MGLLDAFRQYVSDAMPGGLLNQEWTPQNVRNAGEAMSMIPNPVGDVASGLLAVDDMRKGDYGSAALNGLGLLPFVPAMGGMVKGASKSSFDLLDDLYAAAPKKLDSQSYILDLIKDLQSQSDALSDKVYRRNTKRVDVGSSVDNVPTGEFGRGDMRIDLINENRRQKKLDDYGKQIGSLEKFSSQGSDVINSQLSDAMGRVKQVRQWLGKSDHMTDMDIASMWVNSELLKIGNVYGPNTPGYKLLQGIQ